MNENQNEYVDINAHDNYPDSEQKIEIPTMKVIPLKKICMTIGELPTAYLETMSYYEMLIWFIEYLKNNIIPTINNNASAIQEVQSVVLALQNYINEYKDSIDSDVEELEEYMNNYFENLDVQDEINNKLDQMLEDGVLEQIIEQFLQLTSLICFDNVADMKNSVNLANGSYAKTLGYHTENDGGEALYKIRTITNDDVVDEMFIIEMNNDNTLIAELIINDLINIKSLGAYGDNVHEDTLYLQTAINKNYSKSSSTPIYIPEGVYILNTINIRKNTNLFGAGWGSTFLKPKENMSSNLLSITESDAYFINLKDFTINGDKSHNTCTNGIYIKRDSITHDPIEQPKHAGDLWLTIEQVRITGVYGNGIGTGSSGSNFRESRFNNIDVNNCGGYGLYLAGSDNNYFQITSWGNVLDGFKISGSAERYISCKAFANGDSEHASHGFDIVGSAYQITECEAQENFGHGFNLRGTPNSNYIIRTDANGAIEKASGTYTYAGVNFVENTTNQRINMVVQCYDFIKAQGGDQSQGYGVIFGDMQQCNITAYCYAQGTANYNVLKAYTLGPSAQNSFIINGIDLATPTHGGINVTASSGDSTLFFGGDSTTGGNQYRLFKTSAGLFRLDGRYNNQYKGNPIYLNWDNTNSRFDLRFLDSNTSRLGFFGSFGDVRQGVSPVATDTASTQALANSIRSALIRYGLVQDQ